MSTLFLCNLLKKANALFEAVLAHIDYGDFRNFRVHEKDSLYFLVLPFVLLTPALVLQVIHIGGEDGSYNRVAWRRHREEVEHIGNNSYNNCIMYIK